MERSGFSNTSFGRKLMKLSHRNLKAAAALSARFFRYRIASLYYKMFM